MANNLNTMEEIKSLQPDSLRWKNLVAYFADDKRGRVNLNTLPDGEVLKLISTSNLNLDITSAQDVLNWRAADQRLIALANLAVPTETSSVGREYSGGLGSGAYNVLGAVIAPFMGKKPELMEQDSAYQKIREEKIKDWQKQHPGKNIYETKEGLNYLFGSLDNPNEPTLANDTEKAFREKNPKKTDAYDKKKKKIEKDNAKDAAVIQTQALIKQHTDYRYKQVYNNAAAPKLSRKAIEAKVAKREWETFIRKYPEKAAAYAQNNASIQKALAAVKQADAAKKSLKKAEEEKKSPIAKPTPAQPAETQEQTKIQAEPIATQTVIISTQEAPAPSGIQESMSSPKEPQIEEPTTQQPPTSTTQDQSGSRVSRAINALNAARSKQKKEAEEKTAKALLKKSIFKNPAFLYAIGIFTLITIVIIIVMWGGAMGMPGLGGPGGGSGGGNITSCTFYRSGDQNPGNPEGGLTFRIAEWPQLINDVAGKVGIPSSILAAMLRVECPNCFYSDNPDYIKNGVDDHDNGFAYGVMQFYPPTFTGTYTRNAQSIRDLFGKTGVSSKLKIVSMADVEPDSLLRIYSIKDSLIAAAFKIKNDVGTNPPYDYEAIKRIVIPYFTKCTYTQRGNTYNYCDDVWKSYTNCASLTTPPSGTYTSCPAPKSNGDIKTGSYNSGLGNSQHCNTKNYTYPCTPPGPDSRRAKSIDVATNGDWIVLPIIQGQELDWTFLQDYPDGYGGRGYVFRATDKSGVNWDMQILHMINTPLELNNSYRSGTNIAIKNMPGHNLTHITIGKNIRKPLANCGGESPLVSHLNPDICNTVDPGWLNADTDMQMCTGFTPAPSPTPVVPGAVAVVIDPGHGSNSTEDKQKADEGVLNLTVAQKVKDLLAKEGIRAELTHTGNIPIENHYPSLQERVRRINSFGAQTFVSIHFDAEKYGFRGPRSYYNPRRPEFNGKNVQLAELISAAISNTKRTGASTKNTPGAADTREDRELDTSPGPAYILGPKAEESTPGNPESEITEATNIPGVLNEFFTEGVLYSRLDTNLIEKIALGYCDGILRYISGNINRSCGETISSP